MMSRSSTTVRTVQQSSPAKFNYWHSLLLLSALVALVTVSFSAVAKSPFKGLVDTDGAAASLSDTIGNGKWTLVMLWATDCHICTEQKPKISAFYDERKNTDANVVGIALDGTTGLKQVRRYLDRHQPTFPNYVSDIRALGLTYEMLTEESLRGTPTYLLFAPDGELKGNNPGPITIAGLEKFIDKHSE